MELSVGLFALSVIGGYACVRIAFRNIMLRKKNHQKLSGEGQFGLLAVMVRNVEILTWPGFAIASTLGIASAVSVIIAPKPDGSASILIVFAQQFTAALLGVFCGTFVAFLSGPKS